jgi:hypothetical protein
LKLYIIHYITYSIEILLTEVKYIISDAQDEDYLSPRGCFGDSYQYFLGSELGGIVSSECIRFEILSYIINIVLY